ncbi:MAG: tyrosine recombinase XerC [Mycoplasmataceae bacterium CE_OT135]|nr:MAG: tyrosine recombinase XerC [Mycoplasmataceae bacterium CE_OT135]
MKDLNKYINWLKRKNLSSYTVDNYLQAIRLYGERKLNTNQVCHYLKKNLSKYEPKSLQLKKTALCSYARFKQLKISWEKVVSLIPKVQKKFYVTINEQELIKLKQAFTETSQKLHERNNLILDFLFYTGVRIGELVKVRHRDYQDNTLRILGKGNKVRYIFLPEFLIDKINPYSSDYLFTSRKGKPMITRKINFIIAQKTQAAGIQKRITPHTFRRSLATNLYNRGGRLETIQKQLGHSSSDTTMSYIHNDFNTLYADYSKLLQTQPSLDSDKQSLKNYSATELLAELSQRSTGWSQEARQKEPERRNYA